MRSFVQGGCVVAFALGAGLFAFGSYLQPRVDFTNPAEVARHLGNPSDAERIGASAARGFGIGFMTLGGLGLVVPWINALLAQQRPRDEHTPLGGGPGV